MRSPLVFAAILIVLQFASISIVRSQTSYPKITKGKPVALFNGKNLDGWEGDPKSFRVQDGAIIGGSLDHDVPRNEFLCTHDQYGDFELKLRFKLIGTTANGGIQIRSQRVPNNNEVCGYQADLGDGYWGSLYDESRRNRTLIKPSDEVINNVLKRDQWNDYTIRCVGKRIQLWITGTMTVDYSEEDASLPQTGIIGLQIHGGKASECWYKNIVLTPLRLR